MDSTRTAKDYKKRIKWHLYNKGYGGVVEESVHHWNADIIGVKWGGEVNEFEIKVSLSDLKGEIKAIKRSLEGNIYKTKQSQVGVFEYSYTLNKVEVDENVSTTKLEKHYCYLTGNKRPSLTFMGTKEQFLSFNHKDETEQCFIPHKFYFAVPNHLVEHAKSLLKNIPNYGIMNADTGEIKKPACMLPRANIRKQDYCNLFFRACNEFRDYIDNSKHLTLNNL